MFLIRLTVALNCEEIKRDPQRTTKIKPFINKYNWEEINFTSGKDDWKKCEKNNLTIALNVLYAKKEKNISCLRFKTSYCYNNSKWRRMALSYSKKNISVIKRNNI